MEMEVENGWMASRKRRRDEDWRKERLNYLGRLVDEYKRTTCKDAKRQVIANLANFAYDPINFDFLRTLGVIRIFLELLPQNDESLVEYAIGGLANLITFDSCRQLIEEFGLDGVVDCLKRKNVETVVSALTVLIEMKTSIKSSRNMETDFLPPDFNAILDTLKKSENARIRNLAIILFEDLQQ